MKNLTVSLDEALAQWARVDAARQNKSLSRYLADMLAERRARSRERQKQRDALEKFLSGPGWPGVASDLPTRDELHDRPAVRRHERPGVQRRSKRA